MTTNDDAGEWKYEQMHPGWDWINVKENGTGTSYELRPMDPLPQVNATIQFAVKDGLLENIKWYDKQPKEGETEEEEADEGGTNDTGQYRGHYSLKARPVAFQEVRRWDSWWWGEVPCNSHSLYHGYGSKMLESIEYSHYLFAVSPVRRWVGNW